ncbi:unnamed protein product [Cochlearia groenlandica]
MSVIFGQAYEQLPQNTSNVAKLSLEMCTESLGTENGSESGDEITLLALEATNVITKIPNFRVKPREDTNANVRENRFPPPLNSVKGFNFSRMVKTYGEDGRLVVQAIRVCSPPRCFVSERVEGRLRLCLSNDSLLSQEKDQEEVEEDEEKVEEEAEEEEEEGGILENNKKFKGKYGNRKFRRPRRRCNENGREPKTMLSCKPRQFWVTT